jgi:hypothetical protein
MDQKKILLQILPEKHSNPENICGWLFAVS